LLIKYCGDVFVLSLKNEISVSVLRNYIVALT